ncbi:hypothetical protein OUZ56_002405 [Daphnia magna]|uniref:Uncharacterized protein n=1 Tax=Daphnia magna TaxID=35525 RepID=A0ABR0A5L1_9CRUS|nr:hypothetical protein OUZ56_002405 [Daphnia magna]
MSSSAGSVAPNDAQRSLNISSTAMPVSWNESPIDFVTHSRRIHVSLQDSSFNCFRYFGFWILNAIVQAYKCEKSLEIGCASEILTETTST